MSTIVIVFQSIFYFEIYQNNIYFLKNNFLTSTYQNNKKHIKKY
jgi:hypothetical protein